MSREEASFVVERNHWSQTQRESFARAWEQLSKTDQFFNLDARERSMMSVPSRELGTSLDPFKHFNLFFSFNQVKWKLPSSSTYFSSSCIITIRNLVTWRLCFFSTCFWCDTQINPRVNHHYNHYYQLVPHSSLSLISSASYWNYKTQ